ncbi:hypothetical protein V8V79_25565 [Bacillus nitratireducens]
MYFVRSILHNKNLYKGTELTVAKPLTIINEVKTIHIEDQKIKDD